MPTDPNQNGRGFAQKMLVVFGDFQVMPPSPDGIDVVKRIPVVRILLVSLFSPN